MCQSTFSSMSASFDSSLTMSGTFWTFGNAGWTYTASVLLASSWIVDCSVPLRSDHELCQKSNLSPEGSSLSLYQRFRSRILPRDTAPSRYEPSHRIFRNRLVPHSAHSASTRLFYEIRKQRRYSWYVSPFYEKYRRQPLGLSLLYLVLHYEVDSVAEPVSTSDRAPIKIFSARI